MTRYKLLVTTRAQLDLSRIVSGVHADSPQGAASLATDIAAAVDRLLDTPHRAIVSGQPMGRSDAVRSTAVGKYIIYFRVIERSLTVRIVRVRHGARRPLRRFG